MQTPLISLVRRREGASWLASCEALHHCLSEQPESPVRCFLSFFECSVLIEPVCCIFRGKARYCSFCSSSNGETAKSSSSRPGRSLASLWWSVNPVSAHLKCFSAFKDCYIRIRLFLYPTSCWCSQGRVKRGGGCPVSAFPSSLFRVFKPFCRY